MSIALYYIVSLSGMCAIFYGVELSHKEASLARSLVKTASTSILTLGSLFLGVPYLLTAALAVSAMGDFFISLRREQGFLQSLAPFTTVQIILGILFLQHSSGFEIYVEEKWRIAAFSVLFCIGFWVSVRMWPQLGAYRWPILFYTTSVVVVGSVALTLPMTWPLQLALGSMLLFILSDTLIGLSEFALTSEHKHTRKIGLVTWFSYYSAFALLVAAFAIKV